MRTFLECIEFQAKSRPKYPAIMTARNVISYEHLAQRSRAALQYYVKNDLKNGDVVALNIFDPIAHCCAIVGAMAGGIATMSTFGRDPTMPKNLNVNAIISEQKRDWNIDTKVVEVSASWLRDDKIN